MSERVVSTSECIAAAQQWPVPCADHARITAGFMRPLRQMMIAGARWQVVAMNIDEDDHDVIRQSSVSMMKLSSASVSRGRPSCPPVIAVACHQYTLPATARIIRVVFYILPQSLYLRARAHCASFCRGKNLSDSSVDDARSSCRVRCSVLAARWLSLCLVFFASCGLWQNFPALSNVHLIHLKSSRREQNSAKAAVTLTLTKADPEAVARGGGRMQGSGGSILSIWQLIVCVILHVYARFI